MSNSFQFVQALAANASGSLIAAIWESVLLAAVVALTLRLIPRIGAAARSIVWTAVLVVMIALPFLPGRAAAPAQTAVPTLHADARLSLLLAALWLLVSAVRAAQLTRSGLHLRRLAARAEPVSPSEEIAALLTIPGRPQPVELCVSTQVDRPSVAGFRSPRILFPPALLATLTEPELAQIVLHEMEHLRRRDDWTNLLQKVSLTLFPFNPALYWVERRLCLERELACDDRVLRATSAPKSYAATLAALAEHSLLRRGVSLALGAWERQSEVVRRVHRILFGSRAEMAPRQTAASVGVLLVVLAAGADGLAHAPRLVSFAPSPSTAAASAIAFQPVPAARNGAFHVVQAKFEVPSTGAAAVRSSSGNSLNSHNSVILSGVRRGSLRWTQSKDPEGLRPASEAFPISTATPIPTSVSASAPAMRQAAPARISAYRTVAFSPGDSSATFVVFVTYHAETPAETEPVSIASTPSPAASPATVRYTTFSYTAVPTPAGWFVIQL